MERLKPPQIFSATSSANALTTTKAATPNCSADRALRYAALLLGCYSKADCADPEVFATATVAVLSRYPEDVARRVTDPYSGLPATLKWFPKISEIRDACETANNAAKRVAEQGARVEAQFAERDRMAALSPADRRREFVKREMARVNAAFAAAEPDRPAPALDIRHMEDCAERDAMRGRLEAETRRLVSGVKADGVKLSAACLKAIGIVVETAEG